MKGDSRGGPEVGRGAIDMRKSQKTFGVAIVIGTIVASYLVLNISSVEITESAIQYVASSRTAQIATAVEPHRDLCGNCH